MPTDRVVELFRDWIAVSNPGLVTRNDLAAVESRLDELLELLDEIEAKLDASDP